MIRRKATSFSVIAIAAISFGAACTTNKKEVEAAKHSLYNADFAMVYSTALEVTRGLYPNIDENPGPGKIQTAWHQVQYGASADDDLMSQRSVSSAGGMQGGQGGMGGGGMGGQNTSPSTSNTGQQMAGMPTRLTTKKFFVRFDISVVGGRPWRVRVKGHAASWDPGMAMPTELKGPAKPAWLDPRTDALQLAIFNRIKKFAVPMKDDIKTNAEEELPKTDPGTFKGIPDGAAKRLAEVKDALAKRDYGALKPLLADDVLWSLGGGTGPDAAMAMWQADPAAFDAMTAALTAGCTSAGDKRVTCPGGEPVAGSFQLVVEPRGDSWKVTSFVKAE